MTDLSKTTAQDLVAILDSESLAQLFTASQPMRVSVREEKRATKFQVEDGGERSDHIVTLATEIVIEIVIQDEDARNGYEQLKQAWSDNRLVTVQTKVSSYPSMLIETVSHDELPELGGAIGMPLRLTEWRGVTPQYGSMPPSKVNNKKQSDTAKGGQKQTTEADAATTRKASILYGVFN